MKTKLMLIVLTLGLALACSAAVYASPASRVSMPSVSTTPSLSVKANSIVAYDYAANGDLTIRWSAQNGNGRFSYKVLLLDEKPSFNSAAKRIVSTLKSVDNVRDTSVRIPQSDMERGKYLKVWIQAQDINFDQNRGTQVFQFGIELKPGIRIGMPIVSTVPSLSPQPNTIVKYNYAAQGDLTINWSARNGNGLYSYKVLLLNEKPDFFTGAKNIVKILASGDNRTETTLKISQQDMSQGKYLKIWIQAQDAHFVQNGGTETFQFGVEILSGIEVEPPTVHISSVETVKDCAMIPFYYLVNDSLSINWSAKHGNGKYTYKIILLNEKPDFTKPATNVVEILAEGNSSSNTFYSVSGSKLKKAKYIKVWIQAQDAYYSLNKGTSSIQFGIELVATTPVNDKTVSTLEQVMKQSRESGLKPYANAGDRTQVRYNVAAKRYEIYVYMTDMVIGLYDAVNNGSRQLWDTLDGQWEAVYQQAFAEVKANDAQAGLMLSCVSAWTEDPGAYLATDTVSLNDLNSPYIIYSMTAKSCASSAGYDSRFDLVRDDPYKFMWPCYSSR